MVAQTNDTGMLKMCYKLDRDKKEHYQSKGECR